MSGHNKWSSIKHKKGKADAKRGKLFTKIIRELTVATRTGGNDPEGNPRLRMAIQAARDSNMPKDTMTNAIKRGTGEIEGVVYEPITYEGYGPGGAALLVDVLTDNKNRTVSDIRSTLTKSGGNLGESGCVSWMFDRRGLLVYESKVSEEQMMEAAINAGAEDVKSDVSIANHFVYTQPDNLADVRKALETSGLTPVRSEIVMEPKSVIELDEKSAESLLRLIGKLEEMDDVQNVYSNYTVDDAIMEKIAERL